MRSRLLICALLLLSINAYAQHEKIPQKTKDTFAKLYPDAREVKWNEEGEEAYEVNFIDGTIETSVVIDEEGELLETEIEIEISDLEPSIKNYIAENYKGYEITEAAKITDPEGNVKYEAAVMKDGKGMDLMFDENGKPLTKILKESDKDDDEEKED